MVAVTLSGGRVDYDLSHDTAILGKMWRLVCTTLLVAVVSASDSYTRTVKYDDEVIVRW